MAEKKLEKKAAVEATEVKTIEQLQEELSTKQNDLIEARRSHAAGELINPRVLTSTKKEIARLHTAIRAAELAQEESN
jgi:ribosomal protein L29